MLVNFRPPKIVLLLEKNRQELRKVRTELAPHDDTFYQKAQRTFIRQYHDIPGNKYHGPQRIVKTKLPPKVSAKASKENQIVTEAILVKWQYKEDLLRRRTALRTENRERIAQSKWRMEQKPRKKKKRKMTKLLRGSESSGSESSGSESSGSESSGSESPKKKARVT
jgi:cation transport regulator ChaB